jgi:hypothetical protein
MGEVRRQPLTVKQAFEGTVSLTDVGAHLGICWIWCFFGPASQGSVWDCRPRCLRLLRYPYAVVRDLARGEINLRAMGLVYTTLLSLIPLLAFSLAILARSSACHRDLEPIVYEFFKPGGRRGGDRAAPSAWCSSCIESAAAWSARLGWRCWPGRSWAPSRRSRTASTSCGTWSSARSFARRLAEYTSAPDHQDPYCWSASSASRMPPCSSAPVQEVVHLAAAAAPARHRHQPCALRDGDGLLHRPLHDDPQHPRAGGAPPSPGRWCRSAVGGDRQDVHRLRGRIPRVSPSCTRDLPSWWPRCFGPISAG